MKPITRRSSLRRIALGASALAAPTIIPSTVLGEDAPSKRVNVGFIGVGRQGINANLISMLGMKEVQVVALCDVDRKRLDYAKSVVDQRKGPDNGCKLFTDFRELLDLDGLDAVVISTPDHWHTIPALMAIKKGLHVCCEKPLTLFLEEGRALADAAEKSGVVFRTDSECRSNGYMVKTADLALNGYLGNIERIEVGVPMELTSGFGDSTAQPVPDHLDWELYQGPAPVRDYTRDRTHNSDATGKPTGRPGWFRCSDYGTGMVCNWGGHLLDVATFINGTGHQGPTSIEAEGLFPPDDSGLWDTIIDCKARFEFAGAAPIEFRMERPFLKVHGDEGWIESNWGGKGGLQASDRNLLRTKLKESDKPVSRESDKQDFINAILHGDPVMYDCENGHRVNSLGLLATAIAKHGSGKYEWDPKAERFVGNDPLNASLAGHYRDPWKLENFV